VTKPVQVDLPEEEFPLRRKVKLISLGALLGCFWGESRFM
jgi:hypothetical protein